MHDHDHAEFTQGSGDPTAVENRPVKTVILTVVGVFLLGATASAAYLYAGLFNVAATDAHWPLTYKVMEIARVRSIKAHASGIATPAGFDEQAKVVSAVVHFSEHCAVCHGAPGVDKGAFAGGMYPSPPDLTHVSQRYTPGELFWILKNGIKMSGMPSMADDGDDMLWATVGFLQKLPGMGADDYNELWMTSQSQGGHDMSHMDHMHMDGGMDRHVMPMPMGPATPAPAAIEPSH